jgi:predicted nucleotidyltransferase
MLLTKVQTKQDILDAIAVSHEAFTRLGVKSIGLFGSFVKDTATENSDVDMLVDFIPGKKSFDNFMELAYFLEELLGREVEIVTPQSLSKHIGPHILKEVEYVYQS